MRRKGKTSEKGRGARLLVAAFASLTALLASCDNLITRTPPADIGGGYTTEANSAGSGALTVTASVSGGASRHAMPSLEVRDFAYAALLYPNDSDEKGEFAKGDVAGEKTLSFSFPRPESTEKLTIEIFAFKTGTTAFSEDDAILWKSASGLGPVGADGILNVGKIVLEENSSYAGTTGTVSLKVRVPVGCELDIDDKTNFAFTDTSPDSSNTYTIKQVGDGIEAGAYPLTLTVKKEKEDLILYVLSEYINVLPGMCTNKWSDTPSEDGARVIDETSFSTTVYVRGSGGWYEGSPYASSALADDENFGSFLAPLETIQRAVDKVLAMNDGETPYTIYVDGTVTQAALADGANGMADFSALKNDLNLTIKALSPDNGATLDAGGLSRVIYAPLTADSTLTLENLKITGGNTGSASGGGGVYVNGGTLILQSGTISGNSTGSNGGGGGVNVYNGTFIMKGGTIGGSTDDENSANTGGGVYVGISGSFTMSGGEIVGNTASHGGGVYMISDGIFNMTGGAISDNNATYYGGGVYVGGSCEFTMGDDAKITGNTGVRSGGGIYVNGGTVTISGGTISANETTSSGSAYGRGGGIHVLGGTVTMSTGTISGNTAKNSGGGVYVTNSGAFNMTGGTISGNTAKDGKGVYVYPGNIFTMAGSAKIDADNDVYLGSTTSSDITTYATITVAGAISENNVATITPASYAEGTQVLSVGDGVSAEQMEAACGKFDIKPESDGTEWKVRYDSASNSGVLSTNTFYVRGSNAPWYASNNPSAQASDSNAGSRSLPFATIQKAVDKVIAENDGTSKYTIYVDGTFTATSTAALADFNNSSKALSVKIAGLDSSNKAVLDGNDTAVGIAVGSDSVQKNVNLALENLVVQNTKGERGGGVLLCAYAENSHTIKNCEMKNNNAGWGSAIYNKYGLLDLQNCVISGNTTDTSGAIYIAQVSAILTMSDVIIENNTANNGGGIFIYTNATVKISDSSVVIRGNSANSDTPSRGAGICVWQSGYLELSGSAKIADNVGLYSISTHAVQITGVLTGTTPVATFALSSYSSGKEVLYARGGVEMTQAICDKFALYNSSYKIVPSDDGSTGILASQ